MDIKEIKEKKRQLEENIAELIQKQERTYPICVFPNHIPSMTKMAQQSNTNVCILI